MIIFIVTNNVDITCASSIRLLGVVVWLGPLLEVAIVEVSAVVVGSVTVIAVAVCTRVEHARNAGSSEACSRSSEGCQE